MFCCELAWINLICEGLYVLRRFRNVKLITWRISDAELTFTLGRPTWRISDAHTHTHTHTHRFIRMWFHWTSHNSVHLATLLLQHKFLVIMILILGTESWIIRCQSTYLLLDRFANDFLIERDGLWRIKYNRIHLVFDASDFKAESYILVEVLCLSW